MEVEVRQRVLKLKWKVFILKAGPHIASVHLIVICPWMAKTFEESIIVKGSFKKKKIIIVKGQKIGPN